MTATYQLLSDFLKRPAPFSRDTVKDLWTRPHLARQMLNFHLSQETDLASRRLGTIDRIIGWIDARTSLSRKSLCDLGCGPGLYTERFAGKGAEVTGVDFSSHSLNHARTQGSGAVRYIEADYLRDDLPSGFDLATLIYTDFCSHGQRQRLALLQRVRSMLKPGGQFILDVAGTGALAGRKEETLIEARLMDGFWAPGDYVGMRRTFVYDDEDVSLDRYLILQPDEHWQVFNWSQHFTPSGIERELGMAGFRVVHIAGDLSGAPLAEESELIGIIATPI